MFDPNKLNLDLDNLDENKQISKNTNNPPKKKKEDVLANLEELNTSSSHSPPSTSPPLPPPPISKPSIKEGETEQEELVQEKIPKIIYDININSINFIIKLLIDKKYDYVIFEPDENWAKITFRKNDADKEIKYIKYHIYSQILLKAKSITKLNLEETNKAQEWKQEIQIRGKNYELLNKTNPWINWEKLFLKIKESVNDKKKKEIKKTPISKILWFLWATSFVSLILWWAFITFIVLSAKTVEDVVFFNSLWINLNDINTFVTKTISIIFSILLLIETIVLIIYLFKFFLTKKQDKKKKVARWLISSLILILTFTTTSAWMIIDKKVKTLPNWQELAYWDVQMYDNSKLISDKFDKAGSLITDWDSLIWPITIKYDLSFFSKKEEQKWFKIKKFIWDFGEKNKRETLSPVEIKRFSEIWTYDVSLVVKEVDLTWKIIEKKVENIPSIHITHIVKINEEPLNNGGKVVEFDARELQDLWKIEWYLENDLTNPVWKWDIFRPGKPIFKETLIWMYIRRDWKEKQSLDKVFIISGENDNLINWEISFKQSVLNDLEYEIKVINIENAFWDWYIDEFNWSIGDKKINKKWDIQDSEWSSKIKHIFKKYWKQEIKVIIKNWAWKTKELVKVLNIPKKLKIEKALKIYNEGQLIKDIRYDKNIGEYFLDDLPIPTKLKFDARLLRSDNLVYSLKKVEWDFGDNWNIDKSSKIINYEVSTEGDHSIGAKYTFVHRKIKDDLVEVKEKIYIQWIKKESLLDIKIWKNSDYVPVIVSFDGSESQVKDEDIVKFIWDFWDGIITEWDSVVPGHKYINPWDYDIKLKVITESWREFFLEKKLILKPKPQSVKISTSLKKAPVWQEIDFSSNKSEGQITWYFWDFWDGNTSLKANPSHAYNKTWVYKAKLKLDFANNNVLEDIMEIEIYEE